MEIVLISAIVFVIFILTLKVIYLSDKLKDALGEIGYNKEITEQKLKAYEVRFAKTMEYYQADIKRIDTRASRAEHNSDELMQWSKGKVWLKDSMGFPVKYKNQADLRILVDEIIEHLNLEYRPESVEPAKLVKKAKK